jgi:nucleotide-binding universal stress UspA family protein
MSAPEHRTRSRIVAGVDGSPSSLSALHWAVKQAALTGATVDALIAWHYPVVASGGFGLAPMVTPGGFDFSENAEKVLAEAINAAVDPGSDVTVRPRVVEGDPAQALFDASSDADLLVVGSRGHGGFTEALLGSVSQHCVHHARCPVVVIRGQERD